jgi:hypothetical protein
MPRIIDSEKLLALWEIRFFIGKILSFETARAALDEPLGYC